MKYFKILIGIILIFFMGFYFWFFQNYMRNEDEISTIQLYLGKNIDLSFLTKEKVKEYAVGNIKGDNKDYLVVLTGARWRKFGKEVVIFSLEEMKEIYRRDFSEFKPWKISIGDIDGDGKDEISIGVYKKSPLHQVMTKRPFIYSFEDGKLEPKWRGSRLSRPFTNYIFSDIDKDGMDEIVSIEILEDNRKIINTYKWKGFGFEAYLETRDYRDITGLMIEEDKIYIEVKEEKDKYLGLIKLQDDNLIIERVD
ncbi:hypothetical protein KQI42_01040 [Tissierella sp. MSJ-40]|uniref:VCBS repeat-containing protein n=1 Tax=Tissierella simiarum TaxID=2841534 RepID=A0ABS6E2A3_9FIRM|nr:hypothetical protein [Tissierella simiarum]MBU5436570.1 hypothetical protein [Tissierella simiarum]